jgi:hypothetical protein
MRLAKADGELSFSEPLGDLQLDLTVVPCGVLSYFADVV